VLFRAERPGAAALLQARIGAALSERGADPQRQLVFLPMTDRTRFLAICAACDVMVDTPHWSGGNTTIDALHAGLPVVSVPGSLMRSRQSAAMLGQLGLDELICVNGERQAATAVSLASDRTRRSQVVAQIHAGTDRLFAGEAALSTLVEHLGTVCATTGGR
jgi:CRISPR-associated protein Csy1